MIFSIFSKWYVDQAKIWVGFSLKLDVFDTFFQLYGCVEMSKMVQNCSNNVREIAET